MHFRRPSFVVVVAAMSACGGDATAPTITPPPATVLLRDVLVEHLPSPYYHFEYDDGGRVRAVSFASGIRNYEVTYDGVRIQEMRELTLFEGGVIGTADRLVYSYDDADHVSIVQYLDAGGTVYARLALSYDGAQLTGVERQQRVEAGFIIDKTTTLSYYSDGNLLELKEHRPAIAGQEESTTVDRYEQYDDGINVDGFGLIHDDFFDHFVLLPGVQLQKGNPGKVTRTGDGTTFTVDYAYTYDDSGRPVIKSGDLTLLNGPDAGQTIQIRSEFSYY